jgi:hypothetical protein
MEIITEIGELHVNVESFCFPVLFNISLSDEFVGVQKTLNIISTSELE